MNRRVLSLVLGGTVLAAAGGWVLGLQVKSPAEVAAAAAPPEPSPIVVPAELRELSSDVVTRGTGRYASGRDVRLAGTTLKTGTPTTTWVARPGTALAEGAVALSVSGRPVFVLQGTVPSYRDLGPSMSGPDVRQLEKALWRLGLHPGDVDGVFDGGTEAAVERLYRRADRPPYRAGDAELAQTRPVEARFVDGARATAGVQVPADEVVFLPSLPVRVSEALVPVGGAVDGPVLKVTSSQVVIDSSVPVDQARYVTVGTQVVIDEPDLNIRGKGVVSVVSPSPGTNGLDGYHVYFQVRVLEAPPTVVKASLRLRVPIRSSGKKVLAVPVTAVTLGADGSSRVEVRRGGSFETVVVRPKLSAGGFVEVEVLSGTLAPGDGVLVGYRSGGAEPRG